MPPVELKRVSVDKSKIFDENSSLPYDPTDEANLSDEDEEEGSLA